MDFDDLGAASHRNMIEHLVGPLAGGAVDTAVDLNAAGVALVDWSAREPLLLVGNKSQVGATGFQVQAVVTPSGGAPLPAVTLDFAPFSEAGCFLPVYRPNVDPTTHTVPPFSVSLTPLEDLPAAAALLQVTVVEGVLGRLLYLLGAEKLRMRRQAQELLAGTRLGEAKLDALDRNGADLAVPRFQEQLIFDKTKVDPSTGDASRAITTQAYPDNREPDENYRARLALYRPSVAPSPSSAQAVLRTLSSSFSLVESDVDFAVAMKLMAPAGSAQRTDYLNYLNQIFLVDPRVDVPTTRLISSADRTAQNAERARLRTGFDWSGAPAVNVALPLAAALDRVCRLRTALGITRAWKILAPANPLGSRYELGLGVDVELLPAAEIDAMAQAAKKPLPAGTDADTRALIASLSPLPAAQDSSARWLLDPCGFVTLQPLTGGRVYLSHFPFYGMVINATAPPAAGQPWSLSASYEAPGDPTRNVVLALALADVQKQWTAPPLTPLSSADQTAAWTRVAPAPAGLTAALQSIGMRSPGDANGVTLTMSNLKAVPSELVATLKLDGGFASDLIANKPGAAAQLQKLVALLGTSGVVSVVVLATNTGEVLLSCAETRQPGDASVLNDLRVSSFRWYQVPLGRLYLDGGAFSKRLGPTTTYTAPESNTTLVIAAGFARRGRLDPRGAVAPYTVRADLPAGQALSLGQYEMVMNLLERLHPMGVIVDTQALRQSHVDLDGDGNAEPLPSRLSRAYRSFRHRRHLGAQGMTLDD